MADERGPVRQAMEEGRSYTPLADKFHERRPGAPNLADEPDEFKHTHYYNPIGWDRFDPRPHPGSSAIAPGSPIQRMKAVGPGKGAGKLAFIHVRDASGNHQSVARGSLASKAKFREQMGPLSSHEESLDWHEKHFPGFFHDRRDEGRRERPM